MGVSRRGLLKTAGTLMIAAKSGPAQSDLFAPFAQVSDVPSSVITFGENGALGLQRSGSVWGSGTVELRMDGNGAVRSYTLHSPSEALLRIHLRWVGRVPASLQYLGDQWERSYGDLAWRSLEPERILPWYFLATNGTGTAGCGVKTGAGALCFWQVDPDGVSLWLDVRNGGRGVRPGGREIALATIVVQSLPADDPFTAGRKFCRALCDSPRLPKLPVYGGNNWYYAYGKSSAADILADSKRMAWCARNSRNRPWMVIDDGWQPNPTAGPWNTGNASFPDMAKLAADMRREGVQPGIWMRPLFTREQVENKWLLQSRGTELQRKREPGSTLDPTIPEVEIKIAKDIRTICDWGYGLIKHDFSTFDLLGKWGSTMGAAITEDDWNFSDRGYTNAEVIRRLYVAIRKAAGDDVLILGCNTMGHLSAGLFELQRSGDDTSGRDWNRTRKMGVNTLAFRMCQHEAFFAIDADCVGLTKTIPWTFNRQWLELLSASGTPLFVSLAPDAFDQPQREALRDAFATAAVQQPVGQPLDWLQNNEPREWLLQGKKKSFDWFGKSGSTPLFIW